MDNIQLREVIDIYWTCHQRECWPSCGGYIKRYFHEVVCLVFFFFLIEYCKKVEVERSWRHSHEKEKKHISHFAEFFPHMHVQCAEMPTVSNPKEQYMQ